MSSGSDTLRSMSKYGLLCTPQWLSFSNRTGRSIGARREVGQSDLGRFSQSRFCVTALASEQLYVKQPHSPITHAEAFGPFAIGFTNEAARQIGLLPTIYHWPIPIKENARESAHSSAPNLNTQLIHSLYDIRNVLQNLSILEYHQSQYDTNMVLKGIDLTKIIGDSSDKTSLIDKLSQSNAETIDLLTEPFNFRRLPALFLLDHLEIILSLFQSTDDLKSEVPLTYFHQREWRLVQHLRPSLFWYSLGDSPLQQDENKYKRQKKIREIKNRIQKSQSYLDACWILESVNGRHVRELISLVSVPNRVLLNMKSEISDLFPNAKIEAAEKLGYEED